MSWLREVLCRKFCRPRTEKKDLDHIASVPQEMRDATHKMSNAVSALQGSTKGTHKAADELSDAFKRLTDAMEKDGRRQR